MTPRMDVDYAGQYPSTQPCEGPSQHWTIGTYVPFTDGTWRRLDKVERTLATDSNRVMVTETYLFDKEEALWLDRDPQKPAQVWPLPNTMPVPGR